MIKDQFTPVEKVGDNRYKLRDGRVMSRQRIEQLRHPERHRAHALRWSRTEGAKASKRQYYLDNREKLLEYSRNYVRKPKAPQEA